MRKDVFIDRHESSDMVEDRNNFITRMEDFKPYMIEFEKDDKMKPKSTHQVAQLRGVIGDQSL